MAGTIPRNFIDDLISRVDIVDVVNQRVPLKRAGSEWTACCPFHSEKTPSFTVSPSKQFYHCFGCGAHGTALGFLMEYDRLGFPEAVEELAATLGLEVPREGHFEQGPDHRPLYAMLEKAATFYADQLRQHPEAANAVDYLKQRGVSGEIAKRYQLGYAPDAWDSLLRELGTDNSAIAHLRDAGLITENDGKRYDRMRGRVIFPILDTRGRTIGFGGRIIGDGKPKYLNSPETPVFHKGRELYGLYEARQANRKLERVLVVEGYMDVVALAQFGITNAVATLGTATTADHLEKLYRATPEVVFCFDGDRAGRAAAWKALETVLPLLRDGRQARFLFLPEGEDPDTLVRKTGEAAFRERVSESTPLSGYLFSHLEQQVDMASIDGRARLAELARPLLTRLPDGTFREMMQQALNERTGLTQKPGRGPRKPPPRRPATPQAGGTTPVRRAIALVIQYPAIARQPLPEGWRTLQAPGIDLLTALIERAADNPDIKAAALVEQWDDPDTRRHLSQLAVLDLQVQDDAADQLRGTLQGLSRQALREEFTALTSRPPGTRLSDAEKQRLMELSVALGGHKR